MGVRLGGFTRQAIEGDDRQFQVGHVRYRLGIDGVIRGEAGNPLRVLVLGELLSGHRGTSTTRVLFRRFSRCFLGGSLLGIKVVTSAIIAITIPSIPR